MAWHVMKSSGHVVAGHVVKSSSGPVGLLVRLEVVSVEYL